LDGIEQNLGGGCENNNMKLAIQVKGMLIWPDA